MEMQRQYAKSKLFLFDEGEYIISSKPVCEAIEILLIYLREPKDTMLVLAFGHYRKRS